MQPRAAGVAARRWRRRALAALGLAPLPAAARLDGGWSATRPVVITVPYAPGGSADALARPLADRLAPLLGVPVVVENRPGAQTAIAAEAVARGPADGHRLLFSATATLTVNPLLATALPYRVEDFAPVALLATLPYAITVRQGLPWTLEGFVAHVRANPGRVSIGSSGRGSSLHLTGALIGTVLGLDWTEVTYRGDAPQVNDLMAGALDAAVLGGPPALAAERSGRARIIGWTAPTRLPHLPDHPVFAEIWPDVVAVGWFGLHAPARTPPEAIRRLNAACAEALGNDAALRERLASEGLLVQPAGPPETFRAFLEDESVRLAALLRRIDLRRPP
jgi:tripartite-type tricarboxylate transporter receptor subunit TctC